jgi:hypothetical protein
LPRRIAARAPLMLVKRGRVRACRLQRPKGINSGPEHWRSAGLPDDMILIPGVIAGAANFAEHPRLVAQRIGHCRCRRRERVIAGADCGFGTFAASMPTVFLSIVCEKLRVLSEGGAMVDES